MFWMVVWGKATRRVWAAVECPELARISHQGHDGRITIEPGKRGGQPCIRGMRITVYDVLDYLA